MLHKLLSQFGMDQLKKIKLRYCKLLITLHGSYCALFFRNGGLNFWRSTLLHRRIFMRLGTAKDQHEKSQLQAPFVPKVRGF